MLVFGVFLKNLQNTIATINRITCLTKVQSLHLQSNPYPIMYKKWTKTSAAAKKMATMVKDGTIGHDIKPKTVYETYPELFDKYSLKQFSNALDRCRSEEGALVKPVTKKPSKVDCFLLLFFIS